MAHGPLFKKDYRPQFSGHETFPLRYGWLKKAYDRVSETEGEGNNKALCWGDDAIAHLGVGKNMVASMRHWANVAGIIEEPSASKVRTTRLGQELFGESGLDPYLEHPASLWLIHWKLATAWKKKTTWFWTYSHCPTVTFERDQLIRWLERLAMDRGWPRVAHATLKKDVACFIRTYTAQSASAKAGHDDALESPLTELRLIKPTSRRDEYRLVRGQKSTLGNGVFVWSLLEYWSEITHASTLSFEAIACEPGGPGRTFLLDENDLVDRLSRLDEISGGVLQWTETAGLRQVVRDPDFTLDAENILKFIRSDYDSGHMRTA